MRIHVFLLFVLCIPACVFATKYKGGGKGKIIVVNTHIQGGKGGNGGHGGWGGWGGDGGWGGGGGHGGDGGWGWGGGGWGWGW